LPQMEHLQIDFMEICMLYSWQGKYLGQTREGYRLGGREVRWIWVRIACHPAFWGLSASGGGILQQQSAGGGGRFISSG